jgi:hypothetical protein
MRVRLSLRTAILAVFGIAWIGLHLGCNGSGVSSRASTAKGELPAEVKAEARYYDQRFSTTGYTYEPYMAEFDGRGK